MPDEPETLDEIPWYKLGNLQAKYSRDNLDAAMEQMVDALNKITPRSHIQTHRLQTAWKDVGAKLQQERVAAVAMLNQMADHWLADRETWQMAEQIRELKAEVTKLKSVNAENETLFTTRH